MGKCENCEGLEWRAVGLELTADWEAPLPSMATHAISPKSDNLS